MKYPTYKGKWHRIPQRLRWLCRIPAAVSWSFDQAKIFISADISTAEPDIIGRIYSFEFGYLMELCHSGNWYIKIGDL